MMRHLFLAPLGSAFGEVLHGIRLARGLAERGHGVVFLAPARLHPLLEGEPVAFGRIDLALPHLDRQLPALIGRQRCDTLVLVDAAAVGKTAHALRLDPRAFTQPGVPVIALDCWNLPAQPVAWDYGSHRETLSPEFHQLERRLVTVPIAPPDAPGGFAAIPSLAPLSAAERAQLRGELGLGADDRLILWPSASWQHAENHEHPELARLAGALPALILPHLARLGPRVHVVHVGPLPFPGGAAAPQYRFSSQLAPRAFERLVGAADLVLGFNAVASSLATAIAARTPIVLGASMLRARSLEEAAGALGDRLSPAVRGWLAELLPHVPLRPMRAWPLGLDALLAPTLAGNPFYAAMQVADPLDETAFVEACRALLFDPAAADALRQRQDAYHRAVMRLPSGPERLLSCLP
ncbi:MAG: DUF6365 family protein [Kofleriaceae bacterium]